MKNRLRPLSSKGKRISISKKKRSSRANSGSLRQNKKSSNPNSVSNNYFINNINIGNLKHRITGNMNQHSSLILDLRKRLMKEKRKKLTVNNLVDNSSILHKIDKKEKNEKRHKKTKSFSFGGVKMNMDTRKSRSKKIKEIMSK